MRVGLLTYGVERPLSGVTRVALELGRALAHLPHEDIEIVYLTTYRYGPFRERRSDAALWLPGCRFLPGLMLLGGLTVSLAARLARLDAVHDPVGIAPFWMPRTLAPYTRIVTLHDAIAYRFPQGYSVWNNLLHRTYIPRMLPYVDAVVTVSEHTRQELRTFLPLASHPIHVVPNAVSEAFRPQTKAEQAKITAQWGLQRPYVLSVCAQQERKNLPRLIRAFAQLAPRYPDLRLVLAGPKLWSYHGAEIAIQETGLTDRIIRLGYVPDAQLPALYAAAELFCFPSLYEGFGMPILEALACGTPTVAARATALPEIGSDAVEYVDPYSVESIAAGIERVLTDRGLRHTLRQRGLERSKLFRWSNVAEQMATIYRRYAR